MKLNITGSPHFQKGNFVKVIMFGDTLFSGEVISVRKDPEKPYLYQLQNPISKKFYVEYEQNLQSC